MSEMLSTHIIRIIVRSNTKKENNGFNYPLASKTCLRKELLNLLLLMYLSFYITHIFAYIILYLFHNVRYFRGFFGFKI